ncbi:MAG: Uma2 family endonuclease [Gemmataceae bacterium]|nr:Uma2 family endonuclease [Gemmataceae bacterium]
MFHAVNATGVFAGRRPMLIHGVLLERGPMNPPHATAIELIVEALRAVFVSGWRLRAQLPLVLGQDTDPLPDISLVAGKPRDHAGTHPTTAALVVEVADTSLTDDMTKKAELYATANIPEYWIVDLNSRVLNVYRDPAPLPAGLGATAYQTHLTLGPADTVSPLAAPTSTVTVSDLLP